MKISEKTFNKVLNLFLILIACTLIFRKVATIIIILFVLFNIIFLKKIKITKDAIPYLAIIAAPFLLEVVFFGMNDSYQMGLKSLEKSLSLLFLPIFIVGNYQRIDFIKILKSYVITMIAIMGFAFVRFIIVYPEFFFKYLKGIDLWEMGYKFAGTLGNHAPALNMHLAFVCFSVFYLMVNAPKTKKKIVYLILFILSFFFVLYVNTRMALVGVFFGLMTVGLFKISKNYNLKVIFKSIALVLILLGSMLYLFVQQNPFMKEKYTTQLFSNMDKVGKLDEIDHPEIAVYSSFVTRVSIWKSAWELSVINLPFGVGASDGKPELVNYFKQTNQIFLAKYEFPTHNQFLDYLLKFGVLGLIVVLFYIGLIAFLGIKTQNPVVFSFFILFFISNLTDDFLLRFDGIVFSGLWVCIFTSYYFQNQKDQLQL